MPKLPDLTVTEETKKQYKEKTLSLLKKAKKELNINSYQEIKAKQFVGWLIAYKSHLKYASWKIYKASVISFFKENNVIDENERIEIIDLLSNIKYENNEDLKNVKRTSGKKMKKFPLKDFIAIVNVLKNQNEKITIKSKNNLYLLNWLYAGILLGLRPVEWATAIYDEKEQKVIVKNAKNTNNRSHGEYRTIYIHKLTQEEKEYVKNHIKNSNYFQQIGKFETFKKTCSDLLTQISRKIWKNRKEYPSLYSLRHQFAADAKASGLSREEIAALMGHAVDDTATVHYAKKKTGNNLCKVIPDEMEVKKIRNVYRNQNNNIVIENEIKTMLKKN